VGAAAGPDDRPDRSLEKGKSRVVMTDLLLVVGDELLKQEASKSLDQVQAIGLRQIGPEKVRLLPTRTTRTWSWRGGTMVRRLGCMGTLLDKNSIGIRSNRQEQEAPRRLF